MNESERIEFVKELVEQAKTEQRAILRASLENLFRPGSYTADSEQAGWNKAIERALKLISEKGTSNI